MSFLVDGLQIIAPRLPGGIRIVPTVPVQQPTAAPADTLKLSAKPKAAPKGEPKAAVQDLKQSIIRTASTVLGTGIGAVGLGSGIFLAADMLIPNLGLGHFAPLLVGAVAAGAAIGAGIGYFVGRKITK